MLIIGTKQPLFCANIFLPAVFAVTYTNKFILTVIFIINVCYLKNHVTYLYFNT